MNSSGKNVAGGKTVFISYRRSDSEGEAGRLFDDLSRDLGEQSVFMDVAGIEPGRDFRKAIDERLAGCGVLLAIIGPGWLEASNGSGEFRLYDPNDFVRIEIAAALKRDIPVIPVLVRGTKMPEKDRLPLALQDLAYRNCVEVTHARWKSDVQILLNALRSAPVLPEVQQRHVEELDPMKLVSISNRLARYIGPVAEVVVKRASQRCHSLPELLQVVANEIDGQADRATFLNNCKRESLTR